MSEWHYNWQNHFPEDCREVVVEYNGKKHRADILVSGIVIEFQHSKMSKQEFVERNEFYTNAGYKVIWLFDLKDYCNTGKIVPIETRTLSQEYHWKWAPHTFNDFYENHDNILLFFELEIYNQKSIQLFQEKRYYLGIGSYVEDFCTKLYLNMTDEKQFFNLIRYFALNKAEMDRIKEPWIKVNF